jgi:hypothetical protein
LQLKVPCLWWTPHKLQAPHVVSCWRWRTQVWFKQDLRLDDHPGLAQAAGAGAPLAPLFCFDPALYAHLLRAPHGLEGVLTDIHCRIMQV